jgi:hypothetical protein
VQSGFHLIITYTCPVCAFNALELPPENFTICPCCGTEFGYNDATRTYRELRNNWLRLGGQWFDMEDEHFLRLQHWSAWEQLDRAGFPWDVPDPRPAYRRYDVKLPVQRVDSQDIKVRAVSASK